jgi:hypothetical protein
MVIMSFKRFDFDAGHGIPVSIGRLMVWAGSRSLSWLERACTLFFGLVLVPPGFTERSTPHRDPLMTILWFSQETRSNPRPEVITGTLLLPIRSSSTCCGLFGIFLLKNSTDEWKSYEFKRWFKYWQYGYYIVC